MDQSKNDEISVSKIHYQFTIHVQYRQRHCVINHCDTHITHLGDIYFVQFNISSKFHLHLELVTYYHPKGISK